jgi:hypothetical protein
MELAKLLIKIMYLVLVYGLVHTVMKMNTPLAGNKLLLISFLVSVLLMYFTFESVYNMLVNSEIIFQTSGKDNTNSSNGNNNQKGRVVRYADKSVLVDNENKSHNKYVMNHNHKYLEDHVFA